MKEPMKEPLSLPARGRIVMTARFVHHALMACKDLTEARTIFPALTQGEYDDLRSGRLFLRGDSASGFELTEAQETGPASSLPVSWRVK